MARRLKFDVSRRALLQGLGLGAAAGPLIPLLNASAQTAPRPKRLILLFTPDGCPAKDYSTMVDWKPTGTETSFNFGPLHMPLEPFKAKIVVPWGLTLTAGGAGEAHAYGMAGLWTGTTLPEPNNGASFDGGNGHLTGWGAAPSIDQIVAEAYGAEHALPARADRREPGDALSIDRARRAVRQPELRDPDDLHRGERARNPEVSPKAAFDRYFMGVTPSGMTPTEDPAVARARAEQHAVVDLLKGDLSRIRKRVGAADYQKIDAHLEGVLAIERRILPPPTTPTMAGCTIPPSPMNLTANNANYPAQVTQMMDIATHILACDVTRVLTLQLSRGLQQRHPHLARAHQRPPHDVARRHRSAHRADRDRRLVRASRSPTSSASSTRSTRGAGRCSTTRCSCGAASSATPRTTWAARPFIIAGKAGGALRTGRFLNYDKQEHAKLLVSIAQLMGHVDPRLRRQPRHEQRPPHRPPRLTLPPSEPR